jgi:hypothetical protein
MADDNKPSTESKATVQDLIDTAFTKIRSLGEGEEASRLFPNGIQSLELDIESGEDAKRGFRVSLKLGGTAKATGGAAGAAVEGEDDAGISFNAEGHHVVALIAMADLHDRFPATEVAVNNLLDTVNRTLFEAVTFPDDIRNQQPQTKPFHFVDIPFEDGGPVNPPLPSPPHVITKIAEFTEFLRNGGGTNQQKVDALSWVIHLIGDVHQPLHCIEHITEDHPAGDRGGNSFKLSGKAKNLHSLWDSSVDFSNTDEEELAPSLMQEHTRALFHDDLSEPDVEVWARASFKLAKKFAYNIQEDPSNPPKPSAAYLKKANQIGRQQAALAGYRLADRLKAIFG